MTPVAFRKRLRHDFARIMNLLIKGVLKPQIAGYFPLEQVSAAMELAESRTISGKVVLTPGAALRSE